jgi:hypothetical protein
MLSRRKASAGGSAHTLAICCILGGASAHMSLVVPGPARNAVDRVLPLWQNGKWWPYQEGCANPETAWDPQTPSGCVPNGTDGWGCNCANGTEPCDVGQSCLWFSQGCTIGCEACDGSPSNPNEKDKCGSGMNATLCDPLHRTYNRAAACNSEADVYRHNPWRAPGNAPVYHPCGMAGGGPAQQGGEAKITTTRFTKQGDLGSTLPAAPTGVAWKAGGIATAKWSIRANHGGGYQYRLCPAGGALTEECFRKTPLAFATGVHLLEWASSKYAPLNTPDGSEYINGTYVSEGTEPAGSTWAMNPLPYSNAQAAPEFEPLCTETVDRKKSDTGRCSGRDPYNTLIVDALRVPALSPGPYVLQLRWDCEKSAQIWVSGRMRCVLHACTQLPPALPGSPPPPHTDPLTLTPPSPDKLRRH